MQSITVVILLFGVNRYIKLNKYIDILAKTLRPFRMTIDTDNLIDQLLCDTTTDEIDEDVIEYVPIGQQYKRYILLALASGRQTVQYLKRNTALIR